MAARLEVEALDVAGPDDTRLGRSDVETHVRVRHRFFDLALGRREAADVDDGMEWVLGHGAPCEWHR
jgi:hypothetical protein